VRWLLIGIALLFPRSDAVRAAGAVFWEALRKGLAAYLQAPGRTRRAGAIRLTLLTAAIAVPLNLVFGVAAAWAIAKFRIPRQERADHADRPALRGIAGGLGPDLRAALRRPGLVRALAAGARHQDHLRRARHRAGHHLRHLPLRGARADPADAGPGHGEEESAIVLGASGWQTFWHVTLPNIKWGLLYGVILCNARAMGEFGAVSVVSGHIRGLTNTMPLHVEILYNEYNFVAAFAVASLLALLALVTLVIKNIVEWRAARALTATLTSEPPEGTTA
jgi:sulfate transport system permease protein